MKLNFIYSLLLLAAMVSCKGDSPGTISGIVISDDHHFFSTADGKPFFWLGDTGWLLFQKLSREEAGRYLDDRKQKGFNVIQADLVHNLRKNTIYYGDSAVISLSIDKPLVTEVCSFNDSLQYDYWDHVDYVISLAAEKGLFVALVPVWGSNVRSGLVSKDQAAGYTCFLATRYKNRSNIIWMNGGDVKGNDSTSVWNAIGNALKEHDKDHLVTFHPFGRTQSSTWFHDEPWLDFNLFQSGHRRYDQDTSGLAYGEDNWRYMEHDYNLLPAKPSLDGEPSYEGIPQGLHDPSQPYWTDSDVRRYAYWSVFAGAAGFTYGHNAIMQFHKKGDKTPAYGVREYWEDALDAPGSAQLVHLKNLILTFPYFEREPAQNLIDGNGTGYDRVIASLGQNFVLAYTYTGRHIEIHSDSLHWRKITASWYNPRNGGFITIGNPDPGGIILFDPPGEQCAGNDWILVLSSGGQLPASANRHREPRWYHFFLTLFKITSNENKERRYNWRRDRYPGKAASPHIPVGGDS